MPDTSDSSGSEEAPAGHHSIRLLARALRDRVEIAAWIIENVATDAEGAPTPEGERIGREWLAGLSDALSTLAENPTRHAILPAETRRMGAPVRRVLYRRSPSSSLAHHLYYTVSEGADGPRVSVVHIRNASRRPITAAEARTLREDL